jgi:two-component system sensor histidine kinase/response regulator
VLRFSIKDTGAGLSKDKLSELFTAEQQRAEYEYGEEISGLGLRTSKRLIEMMGGEISVESELGKGSTFVFTAAFDLPKKADVGDSALPAMLKTMRVLVVDDNKTMQMVLKLMLESLAFDVTTVSSGAEAIEELVRSDTQNPYELVLMDWMMPGMDGLEASRRIIEHPDLTWRPVIVMVSAYNRSNLKLEAAKIGIEGFLEKPVSQALLRSTIMNLFGLETLPS